MTVGRNDACPCGSGRKYKKCCLAKAAPPLPPAPATADLSVEDADPRKAIFDLLAEYALRPEFRVPLAAAVSLFDHGRLEARPARERAKLTSSDDWRAKLTFWCLLDAPVNESGHSVAQVFIENGSHRLTASQFQLLRRFAGTGLRPYEVSEVVLDRGLRLLDLWTEEECFVRERSATHQLQRWDLLAARVMPEADGSLGLEGGAYLYPPALKRQLLDGLRRERRRIRRSAPHIDDDLFLKRCAPFFHQFWLDHVVFPPPPTLVTAEGDPMVLGKIVFDIVDRAKAEAALEEHPELASEGEGAYAWIEHAEGGFTRTLGGLTIQGRRVVLDVMSRQRGERGRRLLERTCGDSLRHRSSRYESVRHALERQPASRSEEPPSPQPELAAELVRQFRERHYRDWTDEPIPALDGRTPRHAARLKTLRPRLIDLLKDMENREARAARPDNPSYDFGRIWQELGLERPT
ncbi:MAG TPA: SEC-C metal-binding domain-containing protein [Vicinamibacteria bacterium]|nr:SEC-C metal-binding domain-containing protein [Vicinamibacteria bacterium]